MQVLAAPFTRQQISLHATGTKNSMRNISQESLLRVLIPVASQEEQRRVIERAESVGALTRETLTAVEAAKAKSIRLRRALLEAAFTGRLTGNSSDADVAQEIAGV